MGCEEPYRESPVSSGWNGREREYGILYWPGILLPYCTCLLDNEFKPDCFRDFCRNHQYMHFLGFIFRNTEIVFIHDCIGRSFHKHSLF